LAKEIFWP